MAQKTMQAVMAVILGATIGTIFTVFGIVLVNAFLPVANLSGVNLVIAGVIITFLIALPVLGGLLGLASIMGYSVSHK